MALAALLSGCAAATAGGAQVAPTPTTAALDSIFADTSMAHAHWGVLVRSAATGETVYARNAEKLFIPASNMKLITGAATLAGLGAEYRYRTEFAAAGPVQGGALRGSLVVRGFGDPTLSERFLDDPRDVFRGWADSLRVRGIMRIEGGIVGVDSAFPGPGWGTGWMWDDLDGYYSAEFGALQYNEGAIEVHLFPSRDVGSPAVIALDPPTQYVRIQNDLITGPLGSETEISIERDAMGPGISIEGTISRDTTMVLRIVAVRDPDNFFLAALRETLREAGIAVEGAAMNADELASGDLTVPRATPLFTHASPPMSEVLPEMMKPSQNWIAETMLRSLGLELRGEGTGDAGAEAVDSMLTAWNLDADELRMADGSGLSRYDLVSPELLVGLLAHMDDGAVRELWGASMPVAGIDGTLENRMRAAPLRGNVHAKTGSLSGVRAISGYLTTASGERLIFSMLANNYIGSSAPADRLMEAALLYLARTR